ncbi:MAG: TetR/AcrR family transcriptional regulator [Micrococcus sp.]|nr:TetR/AcrR family transcriptional regulator [Micrococcus sp.]
MASSRTLILDAALEVLRDPSGPALSFESVARVAGLSKPGLMYHFPTKDSLVRGVLVHVADRWEAELSRLLDKPLSSASAEERVAAYVEFAAGTVHDPADVAVCFNAHYRIDLAEIWEHRLRPWVALDEEVSDERRGRLEAARLAADGYWYAIASGVLQPAPSDRPATLAAISSLLTSSGSSQSIPQPKGS